MRDAIKQMNKASLSIATGISYARLRKFASGAVKHLTEDERQKIYKHLIHLAEKFN